MGNDNRKRRKFQHLDLERREEISILLEQKFLQSEIATILGVHRSTICRELKRNSPEKNNVRYRGNRAQLKADCRKYETRQKQRLKSPEIRIYVESKLKLDFSPEQVSGKFRLENPELKINHESIYQYIYAEKPDLIKHLRQGRKRRFKHGQAKNKRAIKVQNRVMIDKRPKDIDERKVAGHWEVDTMISRKSKECLLIITERKNGYCVLEKLSAKTAEQVHQGLVVNLGQFPGTLVKTLTYDNGTENAKHELTNKKLNTQSFFCNPYHSWEKGTVENLIGLVRQYLPKGMDLSKISKYEVKQIQNRLNDRPRKRLNYKTPAELFCNIVA